jgi:hypothetical protein
LILSGAQESLVGAVQKIRAFNFSSRQQGNLSEKIEIPRREWRLAVSSGKVQKSFAPGSLSKGITALL